MLLKRPHLAQEIFRDKHVSQRRDTVPERQLLRLFQRQSHMGFGIVEDVRVRIDKTGHDRSTPEIDHLRACALAGQYLLVRADRKNLIAGDGHGLGVWLKRVHGDDRAVVKNQVRYRVLSLACARAEPYQRVEDNQETGEVSHASIHL